MSVKVTIDGKPLANPRDRVLAIEAAMKAICETVGQDPADGVMALLTAAAHIASRHAEKPAGECLDDLAHALGCATVAADDWFQLHTVQ